MTTPTKDRSYLRARAGRAINDFAPVQKQTAGALGVSQQRVSSYARKAPRVLTDLYEWLRPLATGERTTVTPLGWDVIRWGIECKLGDLETPALMREAVIRMHQGTHYARLEAWAISELLAERGFSTTEGP
jgi:hypothetical protein